MAFLSQKQEYEPLAESDERYIPQNLQRHVRTKKRLTWSLIVAVASNFFLIFIMALQKFRPEVISKDLSYRSSSFDLVRTQMNGTLFPPAQQSGSRLPPSPEADTYWEFFQPSRILPLSREDVLKLGKDPEISVQFSEGWGVPSGSYLGVMDIFHKMHCLAELRGAVFENYPVEGNTEESKKHHSPLYWIHLRHCLDMIAQDIQCNANLDVITFNWMDTQQGPFPDFNIYRTCTNWDQLVDWSNKNTIINKTAFPELVRSAGFKPVPAEPGYYKMYGFEGSEMYPNGKGYSG